MAGMNPGMVIKVAADVRDAMAAFVDVLAASANTAAAVGEINDAYAAAGDSGTANLRELEHATDDVNDATGDVNTSVIALGTAIGSFAANAATAILDLAFDAMKTLGDQVWDVIDGALEITARWGDFKDAISDAVRESGVMETGLQTLKRQLLDTFGLTEQEAIAAIAGKANDAAIAFVDWGITLTEWAGTATRVFAAVRGPIDLLTVTINYLVTGWLDGLAKIYEAAGHMPGIGDQFAATAVQIKASADAWRDVRDRTYDAMKANDDMLKGQGAVHEGLAATKTALLATRDAMKDQQAAAAAAATSTQAVADAHASIVQGSGEAVVALYTQNEQLEKMDAWSRSIRNQDPFKYLLDGLTKTKPEFDAAAFGLANVSTEAILLGENFTKTLAPLEKTRGTLRGVGQDAIDMSDDVRFAAEVVAKASLSWSEAMDAVRRGEGTMSGTIGAPATKPAGMSTMEFQQMQSDPRTWELMHGWDWQSRGGTGSTWAWLDWQQPGGGGTTNVQNITVNSVAGDKQAIAAVVKDAIADDWRNQGRKG